MQYYNEEQNRRAAQTLFNIAQSCMLLIVYIFVYTSFVAVRLAIAEFHFENTIYLPVLFTFLVYPYVLYRTREMFRREKRLRAVGWMMGWASIIIVFLYAYLEQIIP